MVMAQQAPSGSLRDNSQRNNMGDEFGSKVNQLISELRTESEVLQREGSEIELLVRQTHGEVEKLANRELTITNRVRDMELNLDNYSRTDMKTIYNSHHEVQMRLFMMRAQVEQLEAKRNTIKALQQQNLLQILAEPNLITLEDKEASFLAGGSFPFPVLTSTPHGVVMDSAAATFSGRRPPARMSPPSIAVRLSQSEATPVPP